jgi:hypothetical protein
MNMATENFASFSFDGKVERASIELVDRLWSLTGIPQEARASLSREVTEGRAASGIPNLIKLATAKAFVWRRAHGLRPIRKVVRERWMDAVGKEWATARRAAALAGHEDPDDSVSETFIRLCEASMLRQPAKVLEILLDTAKLRAYVRRSAVNVTRDWQRAKAKRLRQELRDADASITEEGNFQSVIEALPSRQDAPDARIIEEEEEEERRRAAAAGMPVVTQILQRLKESAGKELVARLIKVGTEWRYCQDDVETLKWIRWYAFSDYPAGSPLKRLEISKAIRREEAAEKGLSAEVDTKRLEANLHTNNRRLKGSLTKLFKEYFNIEPSGRRKKYTYQPKTEPAGAGETT